MDIVDAVLELPKQCEQAWDEVKGLDIPEDWSDRNINRVVICGMGGSTLGAHIFQLTAALSTPVEIINDYHVRGDKNTLVVLISYSGGTEEVLSCAEAAKHSGCKIFGITSGGKLGEWLKENNYPAYIFDPKYNSTGQPRMGVGYSLYALFALTDTLSLGGQLTLEEDCGESLNLLEKNTEDIKAKAKEFAPKLKDKLPIYLAAEYLVANAHIFANQTNETAKSLASWYAIPEANHHLLEGLKHPKVQIMAVLLGSRHNDRILRRLEATKDVFEKNGAETYWYKTRESSPLSQALELLLFSSLVTGYLSEEYGEDALSIPWVDYFKEKLAE
jgi:glucose/mannose-6-phosphate isomerase